MAEIKLYQGYPPSTGRIPKPDTPVQPNVVTVNDGRPVKYPGCEGIGVRVVHPSNPDAPLPRISARSCSSCRRTSC